MIIIIKNYILAFKIAWSMMTAIPLFRKFEFIDGLNGKSASLYPLIGLILGVVTFIFYKLAIIVFLENIALTLSFIIFTLSTGGLHLDGFADISDAISSYAPKAKAIEILKDPRIGALGAVKLIILLLLKWQLFSSINIYYFIAVPLLARVGAVYAMYNFPYLSTGSMAIKHKREINIIDLIVATLFTLLSIPIIGNLSYYLLIIPFLVAFIISKKIIRKIGGLNGDSYGYIIEINEVVLMLLIIAGSNG